MLSREGFDSDVKNETQVIDKEMSGMILKNIHEAIKSPTSKSKLFNIYWVSAAAIIIVIAGIAMLNAPAVVNMAHPVHMLQAKTNVGERKAIKLDDGTIVTLTGKSELNYPERFANATREINLKGEAFFDVAKDQQHPFIVHSPLLQTTVLGTSFEVRDDSEHAKVVVSTGAVKVQAVRDSGKQQLTLSATEAAVLAHDGFTLYKETLPEESDFYQKRKDGQFNYYHAPMTEVIRNIELNYKTHLQMDEAIKHYSFTGSFRTEDELDKVLEIIAQTVNAKVYKPDHNEYCISRKND